MLLWREIGLVCTGLGLAVAPALTPKLAQGSAPPHKVSCNAGVIPYRCEAREARYLLAHFDGRGYAQPGGTAEPGELSHETALREFHEETNCAYRSIVIAREEPSVFRGGTEEEFHSYFARVDPLELDAIHGGRCASLNDESNAWKWVRHSDLIAELQGDTSTLDLWEEARGSLQQAFADRGKTDPCATP